MENVFVDIVFDEPTDVISVDALVLQLAEEDEVGVFMDGRWSTFNQLLNV